MPELANEKIALAFDANGSLVAIENRLTGERYAVSGDEFEVEASDFRFTQSEAQLEGIDRWDGTLQARYRHGAVRVEVTYTLADKQAFAEKQVALTADRAWGLKRLVLGRPRFVGDDLQFVVYNHTTFRLLEKQHGDRIVRPPDSEPSRTFFGRTPRGGLMVGVELPYDESALEGDCIALALSPNLKLAAGERLALEPAYVGVYRRTPADERADQWRPDERLYVHHGDLAKVIAEGPPSDAPPHEVRPLPSESRAMVALTSAVLGPRRPDELVAAACGWHCQFEQWEYSEASAEADVRALDLLADCGLNWLTDSHPWSGETAKMNGLRAGDVYTPDPLPRRVLERAHALGIGVTNWPSMNNTMPWSEQGRPFREDRPDWLRVPAPQWREPQATIRDIWSEKFRALRFNCIANMPFWRWLTRINLQALATGLWQGWVMDGDFWGSGAYYQTIVPVDCHSDAHDHLPGDANYACQRALRQWEELVLAHYPDMLMTVCRPPMDLGVWAQRNYDAVFTLIESGTTDNLAGGNEIRLSSRVRVHDQFFPHTIDWPLLFPSYAGDRDPASFPTEHIDYIMLSALSSAPNLLLYLPARSGLPEKVKAEIRRWLDWGRANIDYLLVRHDLFDWPAPGNVDGSAHVVGDEGLIFLFNPNPEPLESVFALTAEEIGLGAAGEYVLWQEHPADGPRICARHGETVRWHVPSESAVVLRLATLRRSP